MNWRTDTVTQLANSMRQADDYSALPILADALQDADYPSEENLLQFRDPALPKWKAQVMVIDLLELHRARASVKWLEEFAREISRDRYIDEDELVDHQDHVTYEKLMEIGDSFAAGGNDSGYLPYDTPDCVWEKREEFWRHYETVTGKEVPGTVDKDRRLFYCAC
jgi:hypothetical protein